MRRIKACKQISILIIVCLLIISGGAVNCNAASQVNPEIGEINNSCEAGSYLLDDCVVDMEIVGVCDDEYSLLFTIENIGHLNVSEWSVVFEAEYTILQASDVNIIENAQIKYIDCLESNAYICSGGTVAFELKVIFDGVFSDAANYRVYGRYEKDGSNGNANDFKNDECIDVLKYNAETGEYELEITEIEDIMQISETKLDAERAEVDINAIESLSQSEELYSIIGGDGREKVSAVSSRPYCAIAYLYITYENGGVGRATGFVIGDNYLLTAAHAVYGASGIEAYFGTYKTNYVYKSISMDWSVCAAYPTDHSAANDWAIVEFKENIADKTGRLLLGYTTYDYQLSMMNYTVCGYPTDKFEDNSNGIHNNYVYMYKASSGLYGYSSEVLYYMIDTENGQSGSPIYNSETYTVYGIHNKGTEENAYNCGRRITQTLYTYFLEEGYLD